MNDAAYPRPTLLEYIVGYAKIANGKVLPSGTMIGDEDPEIARARRGKFIRRHQGKHHRRLPVRHMLKVPGKIPVAAGQG